MASSCPQTLRPPCNKAAALNRRMREAGRTLLWEGAEAQSSAPDPISCVNRPENPPRSRPRSSTATRPSARTRTRTRRRVKPTGLVNSHRVGSSARRQDDGQPEQQETSRACKEALGPTDDFVVHRRQPDGQRLVDLGLPDLSEGLAQSAGGPVHSDRLAVGAAQLLGLLEFGPLGFGGGGIVLDRRSAGRAFLCLGGALAQVVPPERAWRRDQVGPLA